MINVGIIGYGKMGKIRHQSCQSIKGVKVLQLYDPEKVKSAAIKIVSMASVSKLPLATTRS